MGVDPVSISISTPFRGLDLLIHSPFVFHLRQVPDPSMNGLILHPSSGVGLKIMTLVGGLEHFLFFHILGIIIPTDFHIFQRGRYTTNQDTKQIPGGPKQRVGAKES